MSAEIIDGVAISKTVLSELSCEVAKIKAKYGLAPGLATILVGDNPASMSYVKRKNATARELGLHEIQNNQPSTISETELINLIEKYNSDDRIHGILVQLPLPKHIDENKIILAIDPEKDVDGFHPVNLGKMLIQGMDAPFVPCTPAGILELLQRSGTQLNGAEAVVVGRSNIVGKPVAILLESKKANATVTVTHTATRDLAGHCRRADILIVAAGVPGLVKPEWIKPGATVIDVGVNRIGRNEKTGKAILVGDVDFEEATRVAGKITPVPGGVGPMTIAMLMKNTVASAKRHLAK